MKSRLAGVFVLVAVLIMVLGVVGQASAGGSVNATIKDAQDGTIDGNWTAAQVRAALTYAQNNPIYSQYSDVQGVLEDYLGSLQAPGASDGGSQLAFTGSAVLVIMAAGAGIAGLGALLRRRSRA